MSSDAYQNRAMLGSMVRKAAGLTPINLDVERILNITSGERFVKALVDEGCTITRIYTEEDAAKKRAKKAANQDWLVSRLQGIITMVRDGSWNDDDVAYEAVAIRDQVEGV